MFKDTKDGQTYDKVIVDMGKGAFAFGQLYVALSRCIDYNELYLSKKIRPEDIIKCPEVYHACTEANHELEEKALGTCYNEYYCPLCKIKWRVDSSD